MLASLVALVVGIVDTATYVAGMRRG